MFVAPTEEIDAAGLMEFNPAVVTLETDIADAVDLMLEENVGALLVVDAGEVLGGDGHRFRAHRPCGRTPS